LLVEADLLAEEETSEVELLLVTFEDEVELAMLELIQIGGSESTEDEVGLGVGFGVKLGSGVGVDEAPGPLPFQVML
jgi:hypothetical protein